MAERCGLTMLLMFTDSDGCEKTGSESGYSCKTGKVIFYMTLMYKFVQYFYSHTPFLYNHN